MKTKYFTTQQAADAAKITRATLQDWIRKGKFAAPAKQEFGNIRLWTKADVARLKAVKKEIYQEQRLRKK